MSEISELTAELVRVCEKLQDQDPAAGLVFLKTLDSVVGQYTGPMRDALLSQGIESTVSNGYLLQRKHAPGRYDYSTVGIINHTKERLKYLESVAKSIATPQADTLTGEIIEPATYVQGRQIYTLTKINK